MVIRVISIDLNLDQIIRLEQGLLQLNLVITDPKILLGLVAADLDLIIIFLDPIPAAGVQTPQRQGAVVVVQALLCQEVVVVVQALLCQGVVAALFEEVTISI